MMLAGARTVVNVLGGITEGCPLPSRDSSFLSLSRESKLRKGYLDVRICPVPDQRQTGHPILLVDSLACVPMLRGRQYARRRRNLGPRRLPTDGAWSDPHLGIVPNALGLAHVTARHHVKPIAIFSKPDRRRNACTILSECSQRDIFLIADCRGNLPRHNLWNCLFLVVRYGLQL